MKKLYLTSFTFTTGTEKVHTEYRLVVVTLDDLKRLRSAWNTKPNVSSDELGLEIAQQKALNWFPKDHPESHLISVMSYPAIEDDTIGSKLKTINESGYVQDKEATDLPIENNPLVFELAFGIDEIPPIDDIESGQSRDVVIDLHGTREHFCIGHYKLKTKEWYCYSKETIHEEMKWMDILPLASKDN